MFNRLDSHRHRRYHDPLVSFPAFATGDGLGPWRYVQLAHSKSALKRWRQADAASERNKSVRSEARTAVKVARTAIASGVADDAQAAVRAAEGILDRAAKRRVIHKNAASRHKSRLMKHANHMAGGTAEAEAPKKARKTAAKAKAPAKATEKAPRQEAQGRRQGVATARILSATKRRPFRGRRLRVPGATSITMERTRYDDANAQRETRNADAARRLERVRRRLHRLPGRRRPQPHAAARSRHARSLRRRPRPAHARPRLRRRPLLPHARRARRARVTGIDPTSAMVQTAAPRRRPAYVARQRSVPTHRRSAISYITLVDIVDYAAAIREAARVLRPGGRFVVANLNFVTASQGWQRDADGNRLLPPHRPLRRRVAADVRVVRACASSTGTARSQTTCGVPVGRPSSSATS